MTSKFSVSVWFLLVFYAINFANAENACSNCHPNGECQVKNEGWAAPPNANGDRALVVRIGPYGYIPNTQLKRCITEEYRLTGDVFEYICFWEPGRCEAVVPHYKLHNKGIMSSICSDCATYCQCEHASTLYTNRGLILTISLIVVISNFIN